VPRLRGAPLPTATSPVRGTWRGQSYRIDWRGKATTTVAFRRTTSWELPSISLAVGDLEVEARLDTGGDLLVLSTDVAKALALAWTLDFDTMTMTFAEPL
jgi:hypothetical protein